MSRKKADRALTLARITLRVIPYRDIFRERRSYPGLRVARRLPTGPILREWEMLRVAGSLKLGSVTSSLLVSKLQGQRSRGVVHALLEYGRLCKTEHVLRYLAEESYRRQIGTQLNKGEAVHALRRFWCSAISLDFLEATSQVSSTKRRASTCYRTP